MPFHCSVCNYETNDKSNYTRHLNSKKHQINTQQGHDNDEHNNEGYTHEIIINVITITIRSLIDN